MKGLIDVKAEEARLNKELEKTKPVIFCGDLNVAHTEQDIKNAQGNKTTKTKPGSAGFTDAERAGFDRIVEAGFIDTFRFVYPNEIKYSWWSYMGRARANNVGWRIDYFCASESLKDKIEDAAIYRTPERKNGGISSTA